MAWQVEFTDQFGAWWDTLSAEQQFALEKRVDLLAESGPSLGRPVVDSIHGSRHANMKELRTSEDGALRVLFAFDPRRMAILLIGGNKSGRWEEWYREAIPIADDLYDEHLVEIGQEQDDG